MMKSTDGESSPSLPHHLLNGLLKDQGELISGLIRENVALVIDSSSCSSIQSKLIPFFFLRGEWSNGDLPNHREMRSFQALEWLIGYRQFMFSIGARYFKIPSSRGREGRRKKETEKEQCTLTKFGSSPAHLLMQFEAGAHSAQLHVPCPAGSSGVTPRTTLALLKVSWLGVK